MALANLALRVTGNELDLVEFMHPRTGLELQAGVHLLQAEALEDAEAAANAGVSSKTPPPMKLRQSEGGAVAGGSLRGRIIVVAAAGAPPGRILCVTRNLARLVQLCGHRAGGACSCLGLRGRVQLCSGTLQDFLDGACEQVETGEMLETFLCAALRECSGGSECLRARWCASMSAPL